MRIDRATKATWTGMGILVKCFLVIFGAEGLKNGLRTILCQQLNSFVIMFLAYRQYNSVIEVILRTNFIISFVAITMK